MEEADQLTGDSSCSVIMCPWYRDRGSQRAGDREEGLGEGRPEM